MSKAADCRRPSTPTGLWAPLRRQKVQKVAGSPKWVMVGSPEFQAVMAAPKPVCPSRSSPWGAAASVSPSPSGSSTTTA